MRIGLLAGEASGDILGAGLIQALKQRYPHAVFEGIGGPLMIAQGLSSQAPMERLSVMGLVEPLKRLPELLRIRRNLIQHFLQNPPDVFIGIDAPDFNLTVELQLRQAGIKTAHYVSPSVWAWRQGRLKKIAKAVDLMLTLFPFEADFYKQHQIKVSFVGHPLADLIPLETQRTEARSQLGLPMPAPLLALLPGSRLSEVSKLGAIFLEAGYLLQQQLPGLQLLLPCANQKCQAALAALPRYQQLQANGSLHVSIGNSRAVMSAADAVLLASGTVTLEAMLLKLPMLVCYKMAPLSYAIISRLLKVKYFSLPNLLAGKSLVEELVQEQVQPAALASKLQTLMAEGTQLRRRANERAADAVLSLL
jgi:lipid-A-disaccharide synthase